MIHRWNTFTSCRDKPNLAYRSTLTWKKAFHFLIGCLISCSSIYSLSVTSQEATSPESLKPASPTRHETTVHEPSLRGAVIAGILRFTYWQDHQAVDAQKLTLCLAGNPSSSLPIINYSANKPIGEVFRILNKTPIKSLLEKKCQVVILGSELNVVTIKNIHKSAPSQNWLTICDDCKRHDPNAIITLKKVDRRIMFNVDLIAAKKSKIRFSASLLELASKVES